MARFQDENVSQKSSPVYLGSPVSLPSQPRHFYSFFAAIHSMLTSIGPIFGLFAGGKLLTIYEDFDRIDVTKWVKK
jgi:hypothetical protein